MDEDEISLHDVFLEGSVVFDDQSFNRSVTHNSVSNLSTTRIASSENGVSEMERSKESVAVARWRLGVVSMLLFTAVLVVTSTYMFLERQERNLFETSVSEIHARK